MKFFNNEIIKFDCSVIDYWMRNLNHSEFKVMMTIYRKTISSNKPYDRISQLELANITGVTTRSVRSAIKSLEEKGLIVATGGIKTAKVFAVVHQKLNDVCLNINNFEDTENRSKRDAISQALRVSVFENDAYRCIKCGSHKMLEVDHIIPVSRGGSNEPSNLQTLCNPCNNSKGVKDMEDWIKE